MAYMGPQLSMCEEDIQLTPGDMVEVIDVVLDDDCLVVLVLRGTQAGRIGEIHMNLRAKVLRGWRHLTMSGSVACVQQTTETRRKSF